MDDFAPIPFARITIAFALGIITANFIGISADLSFALILIVYLFLAYRLRSKLFTYKTLLGGIGLLVIFLGGLSLRSTQLEEQNPILEHSNLLESKKYLLWINHPLIQKGKYRKGEGKVIGFYDGLGWSQVNYKINVTLDSISYISPGTVAEVKFHPDTISGPKSESDFDFQSYYASQGIYLTDFLGSNSILSTGQKPLPSLLSLAYNVQSDIQDELDHHFEESVSAGILKALLVGIKTDLDSEVKEDFSNSGTMHVLAVSGLHVGIFYGIFLLLFKPLLKTRWKYFLVFLIIIVLWLYAIITGLSPSVIRAVTMFSIMALGNLINRRNNPYNLVFCSAFLILLVNPGILFSLGFQLSYIAVFSILYFAPKLIQLQLLWIPSNVWTLISVSLAAQIGTLPITLLYFKQFPTYFLISNLAVIPAVFVILNLGIVFLTLGFMDSVQIWIAYILDWVIKLMLTVVDIINQLPISVISTKAFFGYETVLMYTIIIMLSIFWTKRKFKSLLITALLVTVFCASRFFTLYNHYN